MILAYNLAPGAVETINPCTLFQRTWSTCSWTRWVADKNQGIFKLNLMLVLLNWELKILAVQENVELCFPPLYDDNCTVFCIIIKKLDILARILTKIAHSAFYDILMISYTHYIVTDNVATRRVAAVLVLPSVSLHACIHVFVFPYVYCFALLCNANLESWRNISALNTCLHTVFTLLIVHVCLCRAVNPELLIWII
jgi:hypothetical protein